MIRVGSYATVREELDEVKMQKNIMLVMMLVILSAACAVRRPLFSPHRPPDRDHREAKTVEQCLVCHQDNIPHDPGRGDCLRCHRILEGE